MKRIAFIVTFAVISLLAAAKSYKLEGMIGGKYPIVIELEEEGDGLFSGRYAYKSTLRKKGQGECSWLDINPGYENPLTQWTVCDCQANPIETWSNVRFTGRKRLTATMKNVKGKTYAVVANVVSTPSPSASLTPLFKQYLGENVWECGLFRNQQVFSRLDKLMPDGGFDLMRSIYQTQTPIEYTKGMFWSSGFKAHECCDPAVVWAYDSYNNAFYVWIRRGDRDYYWSETGYIPYNFSELVEATF